MATFKNTIKNLDEEPAERARKYAAEAMGQAGSFNLPSPTVHREGVNVDGIPVRRDIDHTQQGIDDAKRGDVVGSMFREKFHNAKDGYYGLGYGASGNFNYIDPKGYGGLLEGKRQEIEDYFNQGFNYNYEDDPEYQAIRRLKEKEADKAYKDGYAQLSRAFDGDIPVNMIDKLLTTKSEITDQADSYIPTLRQMAYDMYLGKGNALYNQYNMLGSEAADDYNRWLTDRNYITDGLYKNWERDYLLNRDKIADDRYDREWNYGVGRDKIADDRYIEERDYGRAFNEDERDYIRKQNEKEWNWRTRNG